MSSRPFGVHFMTRWGLQVNRPNISIRAYAQAMWLLAQKFWPCAQELAGLGELHHRMWPVAEDPHVVVLVDVHSRNFAKVPSRREFGPTLHDAIRQRRARLYLSAQERARG